MFFLQEIEHDVLQEFDFFLNNILETKEEKNISFIYRYSKITNTLIVFCNICFVSSGTLSCSIESL